jgi:hypothetical protein
MLGWLANHIIYTRQWAEKAWEAYDMCRVYASVYFKATADPECEKCKGAGYFETEDFPEPCSGCHEKLVEVRIVDGQLVRVKDESKSDRDIS